MKFRSSTAVLIAVLCLLLSSAATTTSAQTLTGQIGGTVVDSQKGVLPGATVSVRNTNTQVAREAVTDASGAFVITNLIAGTYDVKVTMTGFKSYEQKALVLSATERLSLPPMILEVGGFQEAVSVEASSVRVQTQSGERSATITASEIEDIGLRGRDFMGTLKTLPGVVDTSARDAPGWGSVSGMTINGQTSFNFSYDGVTNKDTGSNSNNYAAPALDSIAEVKVQASNFQAEYGRTSRRDDRRRHQERQPELPREPGLLQAPRGVQREQLGPPAELRRRRGGRHGVAQLREAALSLRQHRLHVWRTGPDSGHGLQQGPQQAVLLLVAGHPAAQRSRRHQQQHDADRARAQRRFLADRGDERIAHLAPGPEPVRAGPGVQSDGRRARVLREQHHSAGSDQPDRAARC